MSIKQISVFVENKPGALYGLTGVLAQNGVDLRALSLAETSEFGIVRIIGGQPVPGRHGAERRKLCPQPDPRGGGGHPRCARRAEQGPPGPHRRPGECGVYVRLPRWARCGPGLHDLPCGGRECGGGRPGRPGPSAPWSRRRSKPCKGTAEFLRKTRKQKETAPASAGAVRFYFLESECFHIRGGGGEKTGYPGAA